jgi:hypothetical protein
MKIILACILVLIPAYGIAKSIPVSQQERVVAARITYLYGLKTALGAGRWKGFDEARYEVPLVYYTDSASYIANPTPKFLRLIPADQIFRNEHFVLYKTRQRLDSKPFHMATGFESGDEDASAIYNYNEPFMSCSGFEETRRRIPDVASVEQWATMVLHEYFHGFQYRHPTLFAHSKQFLYFSSDSLRQIYKQHKWFSDAVDKENDLLLAAINAPDSARCRKAIHTFFSARADRRRRARKKLHFDIAPYESYYELMEGAARYTEFGLYQLFGTMAPDPELTAIDTGFKSYSYFRKYRMEQDPWLYLTNRTSYFYATGFNMLRLLDRLGMPYKDRLFDTGLSLERLLLEAR